MNQVNSGSSIQTYNNLIAYVCRIIMSYLIITSMILPQLLRSRKHLFDSQNTATLY